MVVSKVMTAAENGCTKIYSLQNCVLFSFHVYEMPKVIKFGEYI